YYRVHSSDINVLQQVFLRGEYDCVSQETNVEFIVDCGANIGCTSAFFLGKYPKSKIVAIEADAGSIDICRRNLEPYGSRARIVHGGVWPRSEPLMVVRGAAEFGFSVRPCRSGEPKEIDAVSLIEIAGQSPSKRIDILKIDIEGSEAEIFSSGFEPWLTRTGTVVIETHGPECREVFLQAARSCGFQVKSAGSVMVARQQLC